jgi:hypothetical protein
MSRWSGILSFGFHLKSERGERTCQEFGNLLSPAGRIYAIDPDQLLQEFCGWTRGFSLTTGGRGDDEYSAPDELLHVSDH